MSETETDDTVATPQQNADPAASVLDVALFDKTQRAIQYMQYAGLVPAEKVTALQLAKRINHARFAQHVGTNVEALQQVFAQVPADKIAEGGDKSPINTLVIGYLNAQAEHYKHLHDELDALPSQLKEEAYNQALQRAARQQKKYADEAAYYAGNPDVLNNAVKEFPQAVTANRYLPIGRLAVETGIVDNDRVKAADMVDDVLANSAAHSLLFMAGEVASTADSDIQNYKKFPDQYKANILAKAEDTVANSTPVEKAELFTDASPELKRVQALKALLSAQLHEMTSHTVKANGDVSPPLQELANNLANVRGLVSLYQSATMSIAYHFLGEGPGKDDPRMQKLREHLASMMEKQRIPLLMNRKEAERSASELASSSAEYLRKARPEAQDRIDALLQAAQAQPKEAIGAWTSGVAEERKTPRTPGVAA